MKGGRVPEHVAATITPHEAETLEKLLVSVIEDEEFPLNEMEEEVVDAFLEVLRDGMEQPVS